MSEDYNPQKKFVQGHGNFELKLLTGCLFLCILVFLLPGRSQIWQEAKLRYIYDFNSCYPKSGIKEKDTKTKSCFGCKRFKNAREYCIMWFKEHHCIAISRHISIPESLIEMNMHVLWDHPHITLALCY